MKNAYKLDEIIYENQARNGYIQFKQIDLFADSETDKFKDSNIHITKLDWLKFQKNGPEKT